MLESTGSMMISLFNVSLYLSENLALNKKAWQHSSCCQARSAANNAVDGNTNQNYLNNSCAISTDGDRNPEWNVDLGSILSIHHVKIYFRTDDIYWGR